jgi:hypothetical protein
MCKPTPSVPRKRGFWIATIVMCIAIMAVVAHGIVVWEVNRSAKVNWRAWVRTHPEPNPVREQSALAASLRRFELKVPFEDTYRFGFETSAGDLEIPAGFSAASSEFSEDLAAVADPWTNSRYGYIDAQANWRIAPQFDMAENFVGGIARVTMLDERGWPQKGLIDRNGSVMLEPKYAYLSDVIAGRVLAARELWYSRLISNSIFNFDESPWSGVFRYEVLELPGGGGPEPARRE